MGLSEISNLKNKTELMEMIDDIEGLLKKGDKIELSEIDELENMFNEFSVNSNAVEKSMVSGKLMTLRRLAVKNLSKKMTKWDVFVEDMFALEGCESIKSFIVYINDFIEKSKTGKVTEEDLKEIDDKYREVLIDAQLSSVTDNERVATEFAKKIKLIKKRSEGAVSNGFGEWIHSLRKEKGYSLKKLEQISGVTASYIHRIERNLSNRVSMPVAYKLATALGADYNEFIAKSKTISTYKTLTLNELLSMNKFTINNVELSMKKKVELLDLIMCISKCDWSLESKTDDIYKISKLIDKYKLKEVTEQKYGELKDSFELDKTNEIENHIKLDEVAITN